jgi:hypothetical protein
MSKVVVLKTSPSRVLADYEKIIKLAEADKALLKNRETILKDNISWHFFFPAANTTPWQLEGSILGLKKLGYHQLCCVQNKTVVINAYKGEKLNKYLPIFKKYQIPVRYNFRKKDMKWIKYEPKRKMLVLDKIYPKGITIPDYFIGKNIVHLPTVKCHVYSTTTGAMKNAFGGLLNTKRHYTHSYIHQTLVDLLAIQKEIHPGIFNIMDGTICGNGPGPRTMKPEIKNLILASPDPVAIDAVSAKLMGFDPMNIEYIRLAHEQGLGKGRIEEIEIIGEKIENINWHFQVGHNPATKFVSVFWFTGWKRLQKLLFHTPLVFFFIWGSAFYHDLYWYRRKGKKIVSEFLDTDWGQLWQQYPEK